MLILAVAELSKTAPDELWVAFWCEVKLLVHSCSRNVCHSESSTLSDSSSVSLVRWLLHSLHSMAMEQKLDPEMPQPSDWSWTTEWQFLLTTLSKASKSCQNWPTERCKCVKVHCTVLLLWRLLLGTLPV